MNANLLVYQLNMDQLRFLKLVKPYLTDGVLVRIDWIISNNNYYRQDRRWINKNKEIWFQIYNDLK